MAAISANTLKTQGVNALKQCFDQFSEALITVRGVVKIVELMQEQAEILFIDVSTHDEVYR
jgi:hypothetical protein